MHFIWQVSIDVALTVKHIHYEWSYLYVICIYCEIICEKKLLLTEHKLMVDMIVNFWYLFECHIPAVTCAQYQSSKFTQFYLEEDAIGVIFSLILSFDAIE